MSEKPTMFEVIDKDGKEHGPFSDMEAARSYAKFWWPDEEQDEDRTGRGWDVQVVGAE